MKDPDSVIENFDSVQRIINCVIYRNNGLIHRTDGPAVIDTKTGEKAFFLWGEEMSLAVWMINLGFTREEKVYYKLKYG